MFPSKLRQNVTAEEYVRVGKHKIMLCFIFIRKKLDFNKTGFQDDRVSYYFILRKLYFFRDLYLRAVHSARCEKIETGSEKRETPFFTFTESVLESEIVT